MSSSRFPIPQGTLDMLILQILSLEWKQSETGREAKFRSLTRSGQKQLRVEKDSWASLTGAAVQLIFDQGSVQ
jgi:hypothetical protein